MLTVELQKDNTGSISEIAICCDENGLALLIDKLIKMRGKKDHLHLMTPSWAGHDLTEEKQGGKDYELVNHLRIVKF